MVNKILHRILIGLVVTSVALSAADMLSGTWKLNVAKSKFSPGPGPKSSTMTYSLDGDWIVTKSEGVDAEGKEFARSNRYQRDGKEYPYDGPNGKGTITVKRIDDYNTEATIKGTGATTTTNRASISKDGKTRTLRVTGVDAKGQKINHVIVYDRQ